MDCFVTYQARHSDIPCLQEITDLAEGDANAHSNSHSATADDFFIHGSVSCSTHFYKASLIVYNTY